MCAHHLSTDPYDMFVFTGRYFIQLRDGYLAS